jgi:hypothetical protein
MNRSDHTNGPTEAVLLTPASATQPPAHIQVIQMTTSYSVSGAVDEATRLRLADLLSDAPKSVEELALNTKTHGPSLYRLMHALASLDFFTESADHYFALAPLGSTL